MKRKLNIPRLFVEILVIIAGVESGIMFLLPAVASRLSDALTAMLDAGTLTLVAGPLILWRTLALMNGEEMADVTPSRDRDRPVWLVSSAVLAVGLILTTLLAVKVHREARMNARAEFNQLADRAAGELRRRAELPLYGLRSVAGAIDASDAVTKDEFESLVRALDVERTFPGVLGLGFIQPVRRDELGALESTLREEYGPDASVKTPGSESRAYIVRRIEPLAKNRPALGSDMGRDPKRLEAIDRAVSTGQPALTGPIRLVQAEPKDRAGFLLLLPVYSHGPTPQTPAERRQRLLGLAYAPIEIDEMFAGIGLASGGLIDCDVYDGAPSRESLILDVDGWTPEANAGARRFVDQRRISVGGRTWTLCISARPKFERALSTGGWPLVAVGGSAVSVLLASLAWALGLSRQRAVSLAAGMTADLLEAKSAAEASLREVEALRETLSTHAIVSVTDSRGVIIDVNDNFCAISGYSREELIGQTHALVNSGHHPKQFWASMWKTVIAGGLWRGEVCNRAKDGSLYWVDSMIAPHQGPDGTIERLVSIQADITARKLQEETLRETSVRSRFTGAMAGVGGWEFSVADGVPSWSEQVRDIFQVAPDYQPGPSGGFEFFTPEAAAKILDCLDGAIRNQVPFDLELPATTARGSRIWVRVIGEPVVGRGCVTAVVGAMQDISEQVRQREAIRAQALRMDLTVRAAGLGTWSVTLPEERLEVSDIWLKMLGYEQGQAPASLSNWKELVHPEDLELFSRGLSDHVEGRTPEFRCEHRARRSDGEWAWLLTAGKVIERDPEGAPRQLAGVQLDLTVQKQAIADVQRSRRQLRTLLDSAGEGIFSIDAEGLCTSCNPAGLRLLGFADEAQILGKSMHELTHHTRMDGTPHPVHECPIIRASRNGLPSVVDHDVFWRADGTPASVEYRAYPQFEGRRIVGVVVLFTDVAIKLELERAAAEAAARLEHALVRAESANQAKSEFLANMSHEIRTPLTAILGYADVLRDDPDVSSNPALLRQSLNTIRTAGQHLMTIINDVLDLSKIEAGKMTVERVDTPLVPMLLEIESLMHARAAAKGVALRVNLSTPVPERIESDPTRLRQILVNLVGNAIKFTATGSVTIRAGVVPAQGEDQMRIDVEDTGPGLNDDQRARLFEAFSQADGKVTRQFGGTGLGLVISRRLARLLGGEVSLAWTQPAKGSCFRVSLPLVAVEGAAMISNLTPDAKPLAPQAPALASLTGRILLAEDGPDNQRLISFYLTKAGAKVEIAENGRIALEKLSAAAAAGRPFDLLLTDMQMPEMDGYSLVRALRDAGEKIPVIALTAHAMAEDRQQCLDAGCDDYASKPVDRAHLLKTCEQWLSRQSNLAA